MINLAALLLLGEVTKTTSTISTNVLFPLHDNREGNSDHFNIISYKPETGSTSVQQGQSLELWCNVDGYWEFCSFSHVPSGRSCDFQWKHDTDNVTMTKCTPFEGRFEYLGDYQNNKCGIRIHEVIFGDSGEWRCDMESYTYSSGEKGNGYQVRRSFEVNVTLNVNKVIIGVTVALLLMAILACSLCIMRKKNLNLLQCYKMTSSAPCQRDENCDIATGQIQVWNIPCRDIGCRLLHWKFCPTLNRLRQ